MNILNIENDIHSKLTGPYFIWGTGNRAGRLSVDNSNILCDESFIGYIDNDTSKWGKTFMNKEVFPPDELIRYPNCAVFIGVVDQTDIREQIIRDYSAYGIRVLEDSFFKKISIINRYKDSKDSEIREIVEYLRQNQLDIFCYDYINKYNLDDITVTEENGLFYTTLNGRKIYLSRDYDSPEKAKKYFLSLLVEQDMDSPHRYLTDDFNVSENSIIVDAGAAEGIFSIGLVNRCRKIYMIEPDANWCEALERTFSGYSDKVEIINKCVSNYYDYSTTTIDDIVHEEQIDFLKMDIEGEEFYALQGGENLLRRSINAKCVVCTYHQEFAYYAIKSLLQEYGFDVEHSDGYMWYIEHFNSMRPPVLRRGLIRAQKLS